MQNPWTSQEKWQRAVFSNATKPVYIQLTMTYCDHVNYDCCLSETKAEICLLLVRVRVNFAVCSYFERYICLACTGNSSAGHASLMFTMVLGSNKDCEVMFYECCQKVWSLWQGLKMLLWVILEGKQCILLFSFAVSNKLNSNHQSSHWFVAFWLV